MLIFVNIGITIPALWIRLETRKPKFSLKLDDRSKQYIWKYLVKENDLRCIFSTCFIFLWYLRFCYLTLQLQPPYVNNLFRKSQMCVFVFLWAGFMNWRRLVRHYSCMTDLTTRTPRPIFASKGSVTCLKVSQLIYRCIRNSIRVCIW